MIINPITAITERWITHPKCSTLGDWKTHEFLAPNGVDFTIDNMYIINAHSPFIISKEGKQMKGITELLPATHHRGGSFWLLSPHNSYDGKSDTYITVPDGIAALLITRSVFNRNGVFITSGLYDSGFNGHIGFMLHNMLGETKIQPGVRIGQVIFVQAQTASLYGGKWNHPEGTHYTQAANVNILQEAV